MASALRVLGLAAWLAAFVGSAACQENDWSPLTRAGFVTDLFDGGAVGDEASPIWQADDEDERCDIDRDAKKKYRFPDFVVWLGSKHRPPSRRPTPKPSNRPSKRPTGRTTRRPTGRTTRRPTGRTTRRPTKRTTRRPTRTTTRKPGRRTTRRQRNYDLQLRSSDSFWTDCGHSKFKPRRSFGRRGESSAASLRIINGTRAKEGEFPWIVQIKIFQGAFSSLPCTGTIISEWLILTSASCIMRCRRPKPSIAEPEKIAAFIGTWFIDDFEYKLDTADVTMQAVVMPAEFSCKREIENDFVALVTKDKLDLPSDKERICLEPPTNKTFDGIGFGATMAGFGQFDKVYERIPPLKWAQVNVRPAGYCSTFNVSRNFAFCGTLKDHSINCGNEIGSPLMVQRQGRWTQVALAAPLTKRCTVDGIMSFVQIPNRVKRLAVELTNPADFVGTIKKWPGFES